MLASAGKIAAIGFAHILKKFENKLRQRFLAVVLTVLQPVNMVYLFSILLFLN